MKGTSIVFGLKSLLHPQLPLNKKESSRLLTALTSSFRKHLDDVHPTGAGEEPKQKATAAAPVRLSPSPQSSAALADLHLSSVLTNPLLHRSFGLSDSPGAGQLSRPQRLNTTPASQGKAKALDKLAKSPGYADARAELEESPNDDPIALLERYQEDGRATVPIAFLCLNWIYESTMGLSAESKQKIADDIQPARRTLTWLINSESHKSQAFLNGVEFQSLFAHMAMREGLEEQLWDLVQLNLIQDTKSDRGSYAWKARILSSILIYKKVKRDEKDPATEMIKVFLKAAELQSRAQPGNHMRVLPVYSVLIQLIYNLEYARLEQDVNIDVDLYDQLVMHCRLKARTLPNHTATSGHYAYYAATLTFDHPTQPDPTLFLRWWKQATTKDAQGQYSPFLQQFTGRKEITQREMYSKLLRLAESLKAQGHQDDATWVLSMSSQVFPSLAKSEKPRLKGLTTELRPLTRPKS